MARDGRYDPGQIGGAGAAPGDTLVWDGTRWKPGTIAPASSSFSQQFFYTGIDQTFTVPLGVTSITAELFGAQGGAPAEGGKTGGLGGYLRTTLAVTPGETLTVIVGQAGKTGVAGGVSGNMYGGATPGSGFVEGGQGYKGGAGGGSGSALRRSTTTLAVAGGGGGAGGNNSSTNTAGNGGDAGGTSGTAGGNSTSSSAATGGGAGTAVAGGAGGTNYLGTASGTSTNGNGGGPAVSSTFYGGGGGGGGWFGGGGGALGGPANNTYTGAGGGGGSSGTTGTTDAGASGIRSGHGVITISW